MPLEAEQDEEKQGVRSCVSRAAKLRKAAERERESVAILAKGAYSDIEDDPLHICSKGGLGRGRGLTVPLALPPYPGPSQGN